MYTNELIKSLKKAYNKATKKTAKITKDLTSKVKEAEIGKELMAKAKKSKKSTKKTSRKKSKNPIKRFFAAFHPKRALKYTFSKRGALTLAKLGLLAIIFIAGVFFYFAKDLPNPGEVNSLRRAEATRFYDRTGETLLYEVYGDINRTIVDLEAISPHLQHATVAIEDKDFYEHGAFSVAGITRAVYYKATGRSTQLAGGSTLTQQFVKNALLTNERTITRKIKELILAVQIEQLYEKDEILEFYLNEIPYGSQAYGAEAAAKTFFDKPASKLTIAESAMLASLPQAPSFYSPFGTNTDILIERQQSTIRAMHNQGYISAEDRDKALEVDILDKVQQNLSLYDDIRAPHFVIKAQERLESEFGKDVVLNGGLDVVTTVDLKMQKQAENAVKRGIAQIERAGGNNAAILAQDPKTGQILAMVGSRDFKRKGYGSFNVVYSERQPGSAMKPLVYSYAYETGEYGPGSVLYDVRTDFGGGYIPKNYDNSYRNFMTTRTALGKSRNIPAVKMLYMVGMNDFLDYMEHIGITTFDDRSRYGLSLAIGAGEVKMAELINAYSAFANEGVQYEQELILKVTDQEGKVLKEFTQPEGEQIIREETAFLISDVLADRNARYFSNSINNNLTTAVKTGTTDDARDAWTVGYTPNIVVGVWAGHSANERMLGSSFTLALPIWDDFISSATKGDKDAKFQRPADIKSVTLDTYTGTQPTSETKRRHTDLFPSDYSAPKLSEDKTAVIDTVSGKLATSCTPERAKSKKIFGGIDAEIPPDDPAYSRWNPPVQRLARTVGYAGGGSAPTEEDDVHRCDDEKPVVNSFSVTASGNTLEYSGSVDEGTHDMDRVAIILNGKTIKNISNNGGGFSGSHTVSKNGTYTLRAIAIDEVLYEGEASDSATVDAFDSSFKTDGSDVTGGGSFVELNWTDHSSANRYDVYIDGDLVCGNQTDNSCSTTIVALDNGKHSWYVIAKQGSTVLQKSNIATFTK